jgi:hypothetical protein
LNPLLRVAHHPFTVESIKNGLKANAGVERSGKGRLARAGTKRSEVTTRVGKALVLVLRSF